MTKIKTLRVFLMKSAKAPAIHLEQCVRQISRPVTVLLFLRGVRMLMLTRTTSSNDTPL